MKERVAVVLRIKKEDSEVANNFYVENKADGMDHLMFNNELAITKNDFPFDTILGRNSTQEQTYQAVVGNGIEHCLFGFHFACLAYGQTCSGKTYSIFGTEKEPGVFPRFATKLFEHIADEKLKESVYVSFAFYEIYQEKVYDLLAEDRKPLLVSGVDKINGLIEIDVKSTDDLEKWRQTGLSRRTTAATLDNELSSRSHAIIVVKLRREYEDHAVNSMCYFVDLAGNGRSSYRSDDRNSESIFIKKSLVTLERVIEARATKASYVPYSSSVLTRLLRNCFAGNSMTTLLATVSPNNFSGETLNTLQFASKAAEIMVSPTINQYSGAETNEELQNKNQDFIKKIKGMAFDIMETPKSTRRMSRRYPADKTPTPSRHVPAKPAIAPSALLPRRRPASKESQTKNKTPEPAPTAETPTSDAEQSQIEDEVFASPVQKKKTTTTQKSKTPTKLQKHMEVEDSVSLDQTEKFLSLLSVQPLSLL